MTEKDTYPAKSAYRNEKIASHYDKMRFVSLKGRYLNKKELHSIIKALSYIDFKKEESRILDVPCGTGRVIGFLLEEGFIVDGADISKEMIEVAKRKFSKFKSAKFYVEDAENLSFADNTYNCLTSLRLMGHTPPNIRKNILKEFARVSQKWIIVTFYKEDFISRNKRRIRKILTGNNAPWYPVTNESIKQEVDSAGLEVLKIFPVLPYLSEAYTYLLLKKPLTSNKNENPSDQ